MKKFKCRKFNLNEEVFYNGKKELQLAEPSTFQSYFEKINNKRFFTIKTTIPNSNFSVYQIFSINNEIWILISDKTTIPAINSGKKFILDIKFSEDVLPVFDKIELPNLKKININIYNDNRFSINWKLLGDEMTFSPPAPDEKEGGIIVEKH